MPSTRGCAASVVRPPARAAWGWDGAALVPLAQEIGLAQSCTSVWLWMRVLRIQSPAPDQPGAAYRFGV